MKTQHIMIRIVIWGFISMIPLFLNAQPKVVGYIYNLSNSDSFDYSKLTHLNVAFENPDIKGKLSFNPKDSIYIQKAHDNKLKVLVSIGGGLVSETPDQRNLYFDLISDAKRKDFVQDLVNYVQIHNFDGLDVDLEGLAINKDYGPFIDALSVALRNKGKLITAALSDGNGGSNVPTATLQQFDFINIMAYDATGPWNPQIQGQHSSYNFAVTCLNYWLNKGLPKEKVLLGLPFYGYGFGTAYSANGYFYADLVNQFPGAENLDQVGDTIYYNGIPTIKAKTRLAIEKGGGVMIWQLANDARGSKSLLLAIDQVIKSDKNSN